MFRIYAAWIKCITLFTTILKMSAILNSNSGELTAQLFSLSYFLLKCLCKILWKHGEGMSYYFFKCNYKLPNDPHFTFYHCF